MAIYARDAGVWKSVSGGTSSGGANFTDTPTGTYTDADGVAYKYLTVTGTRSVTFDRSGFAEFLIVGGGGGGGGGQNATGGRGGAGGSGVIIIRVVV
jgi:hypothetical protein